METLELQAPDTDSQDWLLTAAGDCLPLWLEELDLPPQPYRLYRFLTQVEDILEQIPDDEARICAIAPLTRKLLSSAYWLQLAFTPPPANPGWSVQFLYQDHQWPLTVQTVAWLPGHVSPIHNHGTWGIVAVISGQERHCFWRRNPTPEHPDRLERVSDRVLSPGEIIGFLPDAIHSVEPLGEEAAVTFNLYGETNYAQRFEFDVQTHQAKPF